jgi:5-methylcytosine-specific restriction endonuclease McrA
MAGTACAGDHAEGIVAADMLADAGSDAGLSAAMTTKAAKALVDTGMWHDHRSIKRCDDCMAAVDGKIPAGAHYFHDWLVCQFTKDESKIPEVRWKAMRLKRLHRMPELKQAILERDGEHCRYCGIRVDFRARKGPNAGTYDHIDPDARTGPQRDGNTYENVVVCCAPCNSDKKNRTPEEWGHALLPEPDLAGVRSGPGAGQDATESGSSHTHALRATRDGSGRDLAPVKLGPEVSNGHHANGAHP